ncbi:MAG: XdhC family protein [Pseudomonadota bacterium]
MTPAEVLSSELADAAQDLRARSEPFAFATIVRTVGATAAKPGAKALIGADGTILQGWLGGGCTRGAVTKAAREAIRTGTPQLISVAPEDLLEERVVRPGDEVDGTQFARSGCPSRGSVDIFIEPHVPVPVLVVLGTSPVARALAAQAPAFHWHVSTEAGRTGEGTFVVVATQGQGDLAALKDALGTGPRHIAFVGSHRKFATLACKLRDAGVPEAQVAAIRAPAGLDIGAVTPEEIALSILAELVQLRRRGVKRQAEGPAPVTSDGLGT